MRKRFATFVIAFTTACMCLTGCTDSSDVGSTAVNDLGDSYKGNDFMAAEAVADYDGYDYEPSADGDYIASIQKNSLLIVRNAEVSVDVENLDTFTDNLTAKVAEFEGYFETSDVNDYDSEWATSRSGYYVIRIPSAKLDEFLDYADDEGSITRKNISSEDVSLDYVDVVAHLNALETERDNLSALMEQATSVSEIIEIEDRLTSVQAQLDSYISQKRTLENRVSFSTVSLNAYENRNVEHPIRMAFDVNFTQAMIDGMENAVETLVGIIAAIPVIVIITSFSILFLWILRKVWRKVFKRDKYGYKYMFMPVAINDAQVEMNTNKERFGPI